MFFIVRIRECSFIGVDVATVSSPQTPPPPQGCHRADAPIEFYTVQFWEFPYQESTRHTSIVAGALRKGTFSLILLARARKNVGFR
jgi:hypothetical protein